MIIRTMGVLDIPTVIPILLAAYRRPVRDTSTIERALQRPSHHALLALDGPVALGTVSVEMYGTVAYIGGMGVAPAAQRRGVGTALLLQVVSDAQARGVRTFLLDATTEGEPLYRRHGFAVAGAVDVWERSDGDAGTAHVMPELDAATLEEVVALDALTFGAARAALIADYAAEARGGIFRARSADGSLAAAAFVRGATVGPWFASTPRAAASALDLALIATASTSRLAFVPAENEDAAALLADRRFTCGRRLTHMRCGDPHPAARKKIFGQASLGTG